VKKRNMTALEQWARKEKMKEALAKNSGVLVCGKCRAVLKDGDESYCAICRAAFDHVATEAWQAKHFKENA